MAENAETKSPHKNMDVYRNVDDDRNALLSVYKESGLFLRTEALESVVVSVMFIILIAIILVVAYLFFVREGALEDEADAVANEISKQRQLYELADMAREHGMQMAMERERRRAENPGPFPMVLPPLGPPAIPPMDDVVSLKRKDKLANAFGNEIDEVLDSSMSMAWMDRSVELSMEVERPDMKTGVI